MTIASAKRLVVHFVITIGVRGIDDVPELIRANAKARTGYIKQNMGEIVTWKKTNARIRMSLNVQCR